MQFATTAGVLGQPSSWPLLHDREPSHRSLHANIALTRRRIARNTDMEGPSDAVAASSPSVQVEVRRLILTEDGRLLIRHANIALTTRYIARNTDMEGPSDVVAASSPSVQVEVRRLILTEDGRLLIRHANIALTTRCIARNRYGRTE
ncbi:hypothetical protein J6590_068951 [Homalodisca vitripennis]|nr:hypothetical protein J6590_068951 [Homalodisca vitripennis]